MKTTSESLNKIWPELIDIFGQYKKLDSRTVSRLTSIGFIVFRFGAHAKITMPVGVMTISTTPSDKHAGRQILRQIRRMYERQ